jgi:hypothetical protein
MVCRLALSSFVLLGLTGCGLFGLDTQEVVALVDNRTAACDRLDYTVKLRGDAYTGSVEKTNSNAIVYVVDLKGSDYDTNASLNCVIGLNAVTLAGKFIVDVKLNV